MKSLTLIASYLWKDTWNRWREQPGSLLSRSIVTILTVGLAITLLVSFSLIEKEFLQRLNQFGLKNIVLSEMIIQGQASSVSNEKRLGTLKSRGHIAQLKQVFHSAKQTKGNYLPIYIYTEESYPELATVLENTNGIVLLSNDKPEGLLVDLSLNSNTYHFKAITKKPSSLLTSLAMQGDILLASSSAFPLIDTKSYRATTLFESKSQNDVKQLSHSIKEIMRLDNTQEYQLQDAVELIDELEEIQSEQNKWRVVLAGLIGTILALIYGTLSILEFRQNQFISALLRSFGTPQRYLFIRCIAENLTIANTAALFAVIAVTLFHKTIFSSAGFSGEALQFSLSYYLSMETFLVFIYVNIGAILSAIPVYIGLKKPVGEILN